jgi:hypothetical protein
VYVPADTVNVPVPVYGGVPPAAVIVTSLVPPKQSMGVYMALTVHGGGWAILSVATAEQLLASETVKEYVPAPRLNLPVPLYGGVPPDADTVISELPPLHRIGVFIADALSIGGPVTMTSAVVEHPIASVTVYVCLPAFSWNVPVPVYGGVPPLAVTVTVAVPPAQNSGVVVAVAMTLLTDTGKVQMRDCVPSLTVTVTVYSPALVPAFTTTDCPEAEPAIDAPVVLPDSAQE